MELYKLIEEVKKEGKMTNEEVMKYLADAIDEQKKPDCIYKDLYKKSFGDKLSDSICRDWVEHMDVTDGSDRKSGEKWNVNQTTEVGQRNGVDWNKISKYEWYALMNAWYSDYFYTAREYEIENEADFYASMVLDFFCRDTDAHSKTPFNYYFTFVA